MANIKSSRKRAITNEIRRQRNAAVKSRMKTHIKQAMTAIEDKDTEKVKDVLPRALSEIDRAVSKGVLHKNTGARRKSTLQNRAASL